MIPTAHRIAHVEEYWFSRKLAEVRKLDSPERPIINLGIGSPDLPPAEAPVEALQHAAARPGSHGYQSYTGIPALRQAIADFSLRTYGISLDPAGEILPLMGSKEGIMHITMAFLNPGDVVLIPNPGYPTYASVAQLVGAEVHTYNVDSTADKPVDVEALRQTDLSKVKLMWINFPHMPTGATANHSMLTELVALAREHQFLLVNDNPYSLILNPEPASVLSIPGAKEVALELNSLSKSHNMAGWRIGWVAGHAHHLQAVLRVKSNMDSGMFLGLQEAAVEALAAGNEWFENLNRVYTRRKEKALEIMQLLGCTCHQPQAGMFLWGRAPQGVEVESWLDDILYGAGVFITPGFIFGTNGQDYVRISLCASEEKLEQALQRITTLLNQKPEITDAIER
jgi:LL-diaminopimelate aminotransferase